MIGLSVFVAFILSLGLNICSVNSLKSLLSFPEFNSSKIRFLLWTKDTHESDFDYYILKYNDSANILQSPFDGSKITYIHFHGFTNEGTMEWILTSKSNILTVENANIVSVDYGELVPGPEINYLEAVKIMYKVAEFVAKFIDWVIKETPLTTSRIHLIGHSLGAHAAGMIAKNIKSGVVKRITGLDPAGPIFSLKSPKERLDKSQAEFVDVIHTNACPFDPNGCRGISKAIGHVDFYPNGGWYQPGCIILFDDVECSHQRVTDLWNESILPSDKNFTSRPCPNYLSNEWNLCTSCDSGCLDMGFYLNTSLRGTYYLTTNSESPYAEGDEF